MKITFAASIAATAALSLSPGASAITNGSPDGSQHPEVGVIVAAFGGVRHFGCTATLVSSTVAVTAAHCDPGAFRPTGVWLDFESSPDPADDAQLHAGTFVSDPAFVANPGGQDTGRDNHDLAVVVLDRPILDAPPAALPALGLLSGADVAGGLRGQTFTDVGYGFQGWTVGGGPRAPVFPDGRRRATAAFQALLGAYLKLSQNAALGNGGTCNLDSGSPMYFGATHTIVAVESGGDPYCSATETGYRIDTASARSFLAGYVNLP